MSDIPTGLPAALADRYRIERELGAGGMATVYLAHDLKHDRKVAIKVLRPELAAVIGADRFLTEIKTTANLQHPHILPLFDSGRTGGQADGRSDDFLFYVMPFIEGATEVAGALDYAHRHNVIHRDIKPENILLHDGRALVADFGIALAASKAGGSRMTETGMSLGTPTYMSPEQAMGEREITARSDVYALGAMTYEMLLGEPPFTGPTAQSIVAKVMTEKPSSIVARRDRVPLAVEEAVLTALEKLPADRFGSAAEFAAALINPMATTVWVDRSGRQTPVDTALKGVFQSVALSPDGTRIAVDRAESGETQIWVKQLATGTFSRLSFDVTGADRPVWTPDGRRVAFPATRNNRRTAWIRRADASDSMQAAVPGNTRLDEILFDPLGRYTLLRTEGAALGSRRLLILRNGVDTLPRVLLASKSDNFAMALSPDGQWLAYVSNESGASEVYVRTFPSVDSARFAISVGGGTEPLWRRDGKELFFRNVRGGVFAVPVTTGRHFDHGTPQPLFTRTGMVQQEFFRSYDVHPDGKRFLMLHTGGRDASDLDVIFNWRTELEKLTGATP